MRILLLTTLMMIAGAASAGLYKWVDGEGNVHYSQKKPRNKQYKRIKAPAPAPENSQQLYQSTEQNDKPKSTVETETAKNEKIRTENCSNAKKRLNIYQIYRRIRDTEGNVKVIDDKERAAQIKKAKQAISDFCN